VCLLWEFALEGKYGYPREGDGLARRRPTP